MPTIESEPVKSLCGDGDENAVENVNGKRKFDEEEDINDNDVEEVVNKEVEYNVFDDDDRPHIYTKAVFLDVSDNDSSEIGFVPCGCNDDNDCEREDFKFPMTIEKYQYYVFTSMEPYVEEGNVISAKVAFCPYTGLTGSFGFVYFENKDNAQRDIYKLDGTVPNHIDSTIEVEWAVTPSTT